MTAVTFTGVGRARALLSASRDGTVRAFDLLRYHDTKVALSEAPKIEVMAQGIDVLENLEHWDYPEGNRLAG